LPLHLPAEISVPLGQSMIAPPNQNSPLGKRIEARRIRRQELSDSKQRLIKISVTDYSLKGKWLKLKSFGVSDAQL